MNQDTRLWSCRCAGHAQACASLTNIYSRLMLGAALVVLTGCNPTAPYQWTFPGLQHDDAIRQDPPVFEVPGRTEFVPGRKGMIAPAVLHPVVAIQIAPGDRVKKGQTLVKLDDDEARAEVRAKRAAVENARIALTESRRYFAAAEKAYQSGAFP
jgi:multidrug efflux pump subunit AcrA (membrane-fusion protein)